MSARCCECEHVAHFEPHRRTPAGREGHDTHTRFLEQDLVAVKTPYGTYRVCRSCRDDCLASFAPPKSPQPLLVEVSEALDVLASDAAEAGYPDRAEAATALATRCRAAAQSTARLLSALRDCEAVLTQLEADDEIGGMPSPTLDNARLAIAEAEA